MTRDIVRDLPPDTADALGRIPYGPFVCGAFLTGETRAMPWDDVYAIAVTDKAFNMVFNHANPLRTSARREPGGSLMVYGGGDLGRRLLGMGDEEIRDLFRRDLEAVLPGAKRIVREVLVQRWERALPYAPPAARASRRPSSARSGGSPSPATTSSTRRWRPRRRRASRRPRSGTAV